jgi:hypothetical protein
LLVFHTTKQGSMFTSFIAKYKINQLGHACNTISYKKEGCLLMFLKYSDPDPPLSWFPVQVISIFHFLLGFNDVLKGCLFLLQLHFVCHFRSNVFKILGPDAYCDFDSCKP